MRLSPELNVAAQTRERIGQANSFLDFLLDGCPANSLFAITEMSLDNDGKKRVNSYFHKFEYNKLMEKSTGIVNLCDFNHSDLYIRLSMLKAVPDFGRGKKEDTLGCNVLWVDLDCKKYDRLEEVCNKLRELDLLPSWINKSGQGYHLYWKLESFVTDNIEIEQRNKWLCKLLDADNCWSIIHILRIPGTVNFKYDNESLPVTIISNREYLTDYYYELIDFEKIKLTDDEKEYDLNIIEEKLEDNFLEPLPVNLKDRITVGAENATDRSSNDWYIATKLLELGYSSGQVLAVMTHKLWKAGEKARQHGFHYAIYTIAKSVAHFRSKTSQHNGLLREIIEKTLFYLADNGSKKKRKLDYGSELVIPCVKELQKQGVRFYVDADNPTTSYLVTATGEIIPATENETEYKDFIGKISGFTDSEKEFNILKNGIAAHCRQFGEHAKVTNWCYSDITKRTIYVNNCNQKDRRITKIKDGSINSVTNGTDNILVQKSLLPFQELNLEYIADYKVGLQEMYNTMITQLAVPQTEQLFFFGYLFSLMILNTLPVYTYPYIHLTGNAGCGKSQTLMSLATWLYGAPNLINTTSAANYRTASREVLLPFDDYEYMDASVKQFILTAVTGITRQKSGMKTTDVVNQTAHVPMAITSINILEGEAFRRRSFVIKVDKKRYGSGNYSEIFWKTIADKRSYWMSCYFSWLTDRFFKNYSQEMLMGFIKDIENKIVVDSYKSLAPFTAVAYYILSDLSDVINIPFKKSIKLQRSIIDDWFDYFGLNDLADYKEQNGLLVALNNIFNMGYLQSRGETIFLNKSKDEQGYTDSNRIIHSILRESNFRLRMTEERYFPNDGVEYLGLEGSTADWLTSLQLSSREYFKGYTPAKLTTEFQRLVEGDFFFDNSNASDPLTVGSYLLIKLKRYGVGHNERGWRILVKTEQLEDKTDVET